MSVPKLRFPEFLDGGEWEEKKLGDITEKISDGIHSTPIYNENGQYYFVNGNNLAEDKIVINESTKRVDEIEYLKYKTELSSQTILISINGTLGNLAFFNGEKVVLGKSACYINLKPNENKYFVFNLLKTSNIQKYFEKELTGSTIKNLSLASIKNAKAFFPIPAEQQKIADCLSSLSDRITAEIKKLDTLKAHKKGLMQQLFPAEGETLPKLRFPEFQDSGEWDIKSLRDIAKNLDSKRVPITESNRVKGDIPYYGASGVIDYVKDYIFDEDLLCISEDGANLVARTYPIAFSISGKTWVNNHAHVLKFKKSYTQVIIENYLNSISLVNFLTGMAQPKLNRAKLDIIPIPLPSFAEQQKIADCLSSIDELITAQTEKIDALKLHKKGLMQQLFPSVEEVRA